MPREFENLENLIDFLRARGIDTVTLTGRVATTTSPGGEQIAFRGRIAVEADLGAGEQASYNDEVMPYITTTKSPDLPANEEHAGDLRSAQLALARQLRSYRGEYKGLVDAAKARLTAMLAEAGIKAVERED